MGPQKRKMVIERSILIFLLGMVIPSYADPLSGATFSPAIFGRDRAGKGHCF
jgi:hypothetical protein